MNRIALSNGSWFDKDRAESFEESSTWDGNNYISDATGSQWDHEELFLTAGGNWIKHSWSQWQGSIPSWRQINEGAAVQWLLQNGHDAKAAEMAPETVAELEL